MTKICMNEACRATATLEWKKGWGLKSGGFATLCHNCGTAYENLAYCETFHVEESGWRECRICGKRIHCGCIASKYMHDYLDFGGIGCVNCAKNLETQSLRPIEILNGDIRNGFSRLAAKNISDLQPSFIQSRMGANSDIDKANLVQLNRTLDMKELSHFPQTQRSNGSSSIGQAKEILLPLQQSVGTTIFSKPENSRPMGVKDIYEPLSHPSLNFSLTPPLDTSNSLVPSPDEVALGREQSKVSLLKVQRARQVFPKAPKSGPHMGSEGNKGMASQMRVARPPGEGRGRNQLLPRYWPRITEQELQKISGDLNSTIVPLFEKVLSASDAGRIGRLVLPKACAEAYFPPISQSDGVPIRIQDITGREWTFQFRFWPNNNSRMYVLEGITPCIQNMQLQAGDTVIFSRLDPGGKLVMGYRKASNNVDMQEATSSSNPNGAPSGETSLSTANDNPAANGDGKNEESSQRPMVSEKKRARNIGSKSKRLLMHSEDAMELRLTWEEAQELLRPSPSAKPTIIMVEDHEIEEYNEPPVFGKRTIFTDRGPGEQEQWAQCDSCSKWRRIPADVLLPPKWTCSENIWDFSRCSCSAPDEVIPEDLGRFLRVGKEPKKRRIRGEIPKVAEERKPSGLDALATAAVLGDDACDSGEPSTGATTKHPRHRPGCTCIVCIQPPSGKGTHKPTCICNVCMTVKRRFKTLMLRRKRRQSEREAEIARGKEEHATSPREDEEKGAPPINPLQEEEGESQDNKLAIDVAETSKGQLDLNCHPVREDDMAPEATSLNMMNLVHETSLPLETYMRENGLGNLDSLLSQGVSESKGHPLEGGFFSSLVKKHGEGGEEG